MPGMPMHRAVTSQLQNAARVFTKYSASHPELVQSAAGCITWMIGNAVTQSGREKQSGTDVRELLIYGSYGAIVSNVGHVWYRYLNVVTNRTFRLGTYPGIGTKLAADVFLFNPIHVMCLLSYTHILKGKRIQELPTELKRSIGPMVVAEAAIWTPVQFLNFRLLPAQHQQMFVNVMSIVEAAVLSWLAERGLGH